MRSNVGKSKTRGEKLATSREPFTIAESQSANEDQAEISLRTGGSRWKTKPLTMQTDKSPSPSRSSRYASRHGDSSPNTDERSPTTRGTSLSSNPGGQPRSASASTAQKASTPNPLGSAKKATTSFPTSSASQLDNNEDKDDFENASDDFPSERRKERGITYHEKRRDEASSSASRRKPADDKSQDDIERHSNDFLKARRKERESTSRKKGRKDDSIQVHVKSKKKRIQDTRPRGKVDPYNNKESNNSTLIPTRTTTSKPYSMIHQNQTQAVPSQIVLKNN
jgi:hypothetical protein